jgi:hypothetical protein
MLSDLIENISTHRWWLCPTLAIHVWGTATISARARGDQIKRVASPTMTAKDFSDVYGVEELGTEIMNLLAMPTLLALSYTSKQNFLQVHRYTRFKLGRILAPFDLSSNQLLRILRMTHSIVFGSIALKATAPASLPIFSNHLDIVVPASQLFMLESWLVLGRKYTCDSSVQYHQRSPPVISVTSLARCIDQTKMVINLIAVQTPAHVYQIVCYSPNTAEMNVIAGQGLLLPYRSLLGQGKVVHNHVANIAGVQSAARFVQTRLFKAAVLSQITMEARGFAFVPQQQHVPIRCDCSHGAACPYRFRNPNDRHRSFMRLFTDSEWITLESDGPRALHIALPHLPSVIWRLADRKGGSQGLSIVMW